MPPDEDGLAEMYAQLQRIEAKGDDTNESVKRLDLAIRGDGREEAGLAAKVRENRRSIGGMKRGIWLAVAGLFVLAGEAVKRWLWAE